MPIKADDLIYDQPQQPGCGGEDLNPNFHNLQSSSRVCKRFQSLLTLADHATQITSSIL